MPAYAKQTQYSHAFHIHFREKKEKTRISPEKKGGPRRDAFSKMKETQILMKCVAQKIL
jgi:hypothetical protein